MLATLLLSRAPLVQGKQAPEHRFWRGAGNAEEPARLLPSATTRYSAETDRGVSSKGDRRDNYEIRCASCVRDFTSSFRKTLRRWYSTVLWVINS
jgi:hypothetical protein